MLTLGVCGCSFMAATKTYGSRPDLLNSEGKHFTEIIAKNLNYKYRTWARGASSHLLIALQLEEAIASKCDIILVADTQPHRTEFAINNDNNLDINKISVTDFVYRGYPDFSTDQIGPSSNLFISETISNILNLQAQNYLDIDDLKVKSLSIWFNDLYHASLSAKKDSYITHSMITQLRASNSKWLFFTNVQSDQGLELLKNDNDPRIVRTNSLMPGFYVDASSPRRYHTTDEAQEVLAYKVLEYAKKHNLF